MISHDRHLVELVADGLWLVAGGRVRAYDGDLDDYRRLLLRDLARAPGRRAEAPRERPPERRRAARAAGPAARKQAKEAERQVARLQREKGRIEAKLADPATYGNGATDAAALQREAATLAARLSTAESRWLEAEAEIETIEAD